MGLLGQAEVGLSFNEGRGMNNGLGTGVGKGKGGAKGKGRGGDIQSHGGVMGVGLPGQVELGLSFSEGQGMGKGTGQCYGSSVSCVEAGGTTFLAGLCGPGHCGCCMGCGCLGVIDVADAVDFGDELHPMLQPGEAAQHVGDRVWCCANPHRSG